MLSSHSIPIQSEEERAVYNCDFLPNCVSDDMVRKAEGRLKKFAPYDEKLYVSRHPDVAANALKPTEHLIRYGCFEGRKETFSRARVADFLSKIQSPADDFSLVAPKVLSADSASTSIRRLAQELPAVGIFAHSQGSRLLKEFAHELYAAFENTGVKCSLLTEESPISECPAIPIFVAPHEFFIIGKGPDWIRDDVLRRSIIFNVEQIQTEWFLRGMPFILMAKGVIDLSFQSAFLLKQCGIPSMHLTLASQPGESCLLPEDARHPFLLPLPPAAREPGDIFAPLSERCIDVSFFSTSSPRRESFLAENAQLFSQYQTFLYYRRDELRGAVQDTRAEQSLNRLSRHISRHSKIALNVHRDDNKYFEWHRIVRLAMDSNALVISEPCLPHPLFRAGTHYIEETSEGMGDRIRWVLETSEGMQEAERIRSNAFTLLQTQFEMRNSSLQLVQFLAQLNAQKPDGGV